MVKALKVAEVNQDLGSSDQEVCLAFRINLVTATTSVSVVSRVREHYKD